MLKALGRSPPFSFPGEAPALPSHLKDHLTSRSASFPTCEGSSQALRRPVRTKTAPTHTAPATLHTRPSGETPPLVPGGTGRSVVMSLGLAWLRMPTSLAQVSAVQQQ